MNQEIWKDIPDFEGIFQISNFGRLKSFKKNKEGRILSNKEKSGSYLSVVLSFKSKTKYTRLHRLVAEIFIPNIENKRAVNHKDCNKQNNCIDNLEWVTDSENIQHAIKSHPDMLKNVKHYNQVVKPKKIEQYTLEGVLINVFNNAKEASESSGVCQRNILQVANKSEYKKGMTRKQAGGYIWKNKE